MKIMNTDTRSLVNLKEKNDEEKHRGTSLSNCCNTVIKNFTDSQREKKITLSEKKINSKHLIRLNESQKTVE